ncbi:hypothetical protein BpHYR1_029760 [Brachionus plicatilis]|uniref:Uncharacterized protein n=1 Tax=Brachionus plicatilis TaxID=10195 RepID=A0A3M7PV70_BRAPC|nr:hypothetical protein BpHYR1_029760 [Brachionus plicatilis]
MEKVNKPSENDSEYSVADLEDENKDSSEKKNKKTSYRDNEKAKNQKCARNNSGKQIQAQTNQSSSFNSKYNENENPTLQYIKEAQVPLFNYKNLVNTYETQDN